MSIPRAPDIAVVGAGPAGLAAAIESARLGARVLLIDEYAEAGGQYHRQPASPMLAASAQARSGRALADEAAALGVETWTGATVWGAFEGPTLDVLRAGRSVTIAPKRIVIATGAHDRPLPFPGWTLPGVMTPGALQTLVKAHGLLPGRRIVVAGSGPFLAVVAGNAAAAGAQVRLVEAAKPGWAFAGLLLRHPERWAEALAILASLRRVDTELGRIVVRAEGDERLRAVVTQRVDAQGAPIPGSDARESADVLALAYGFRAQPELARLLGCACGYDEARGGRHVSIDPETGRSSVEAVYAAGECAGVSGSIVARAGGRIAGLCAARSLGCWNDEAAGRLDDARRLRRRAQAFADGLNRLYAPGPGLDVTITADTVVCRCEAVTRSQIESAADAGAGDAAGAKRWTRCAMGPCQGRMCGWPLARILSRQLGQPQADVDALSARVPVKPVRLEEILRSRAD